LYQCLLLFLHHQPCPITTNSFPLFNCLLLLLSRPIAQCSPSLASREAIAHFPRLTEFLPPIDSLLPFRDLLLQSGLPVLGIVRGVAGTPIFALCPTVLTHVFFVQGFFAMKLDSVRDTVTHSRLDCGMLHADCLCVLAFLSPSSRLRQSSFFTCDRIAYGGSTNPYPRENYLFAIFTNCIPSVSPPLTVSKLFLLSTISLLRPFRRKIQEF